MAAKKISVEKSWSEAQNGVTLTLIEGRTYSILFWAHSEACNAYTIGEGGKISVDYSSYKDGGFAKMEQMDAFYATATITVSVANSNNNSVELTRPFAQLNFADKTTEPVKDTHKTVVTFHTIPTAFNPFTGEVETTDSSNDADDITFTFSEFSSETLNIDGKEHYYISSNYLFASDTEETTVEATIAVPFQNVTPIKTFVFKEQTAIKLGTNKRTNVIGMFLTPYSTTP